MIYFLMTVTITLIKYPSMYNIVEQRPNSSDSSKPEDHSCRFVWYKFDFVSRGKEYIERFMILFI